MSNHGYPRVMSTSLDRYRTIADALAALLKPQVEAVVHDLAASKIVHIAGNFSRRKVGDSSLTELADLSPFAGPVIGPYAKANWDGRALKSISIVLPDDSGKPAGLLCINVDVSAFEAVRKVMDAFAIPSANAQATAAQIFRSDWREAINHSIAEFLDSQSTSLAGLDADGNARLIAALDDQGFFGIRHAAGHISTALGVSRATLYGRLKKVRASKGS